VTVLTRRRITAYPRVIFIVIWASIVLNWIGASGWRGWGGQLLFSDFLVFYGAGLLFRTAPGSLYDFNAQLALQQSLVAPTPLTGTGPFSHPPYVAPLLEGFSLLPLTSALAVWMALSCLALCGCLVLVRSLFAPELTRAGISTRTLVVIAFSAAPVVAGLYSGQMHTFALLASLAVIVFTLNDRPWFAGIVTGLAAIKPQLALAFGLFFLARGYWQALTGAAVTFAALNATVFVQVPWTTATGLYADYLRTAGLLLSIPFNSGFPSYLLMTPYGLIAGLLGVNRQELVGALSNVLALAVVGWFLYSVRRSRHAHGDAERRALALTLLLPFLITPYWMLYDAASLLVASVLLSSGSPENAGRWSAALYLWLWMCAPVAAIVAVPLGTLAAVALWVYSATGVRLTTSARPPERPAVT
jgi:hypothetical protein